MLLSDQELKESHALACALTSKAPVKEMEEKEISLFDYTNENARDEWVMRGILVSRKISNTGSAKPQSSLDDSSSSPENSSNGTKLWNRLKQLTFGTET